MNQENSTPKKKLGLLPKIGIGCGGLLVLFMIIGGIINALGKSEQVMATAAGEIADGVSDSKPAKQSGAVAEQTATSETVSQKNAVRAAKNYLNIMPFSRKGLINQLEAEGYNTNDATYGVDNVKTDWMEQAVRAAKKYLDIMPFSRKGLIEQLEAEGYSTSEATHGVDGVGLK